MINRFIDFATRVLVWIGGLLILAVMCVTIGDIVARWTLSVGFLGLVDITQFAVVGFAYLSLPYVFRTDANVAIALYDDRLKPWQDVCLRLLSGVLSLGVLSVLLWYGWQRAGRTLRFGDVSQNIEIPMVWFWGLILFGLAMAWVIVALSLFDTIRRLKGQPDGH